MTTPARAAAATALSSVAVGLSFAVLLARVVGAERQALAATMPATTPQGALVVFGGRFWPAPDGGVLPSGEVQARLDHALQLWAHGVAPEIVVSGGIDDVTDEVEAMTHYLVGAGVPAAAVVPGRPGENTRATLTALRRMSDEDGIGPFVAVSSAYHARRIRDEARRAGVALTVSSPPGAPETNLPHVRRVRIGTEVVATVWYALPVAWTSHTPAPLRRLRHRLPLWLARAREVPPRHPAIAATS